jgi:hypothetical protein
MDELLVWLAEQSEQAREAMRESRGLRDHAVFHASAMARYCAMQQVIQQITASAHVTSASVPASSYTTGSPSGHASALAS